MRWVKTTLTSMWGAIGGTVPASRAELYCRTEEIRSSMLDTLRHGNCALVPSLQNRIECAAGIQALWFMRSDWMAAIAVTQGETVARAHLSALNARFSGLLPEGLQSRPSTLSRF
jgi:hypothetical protein